MKVPASTPSWIGKSWRTRGITHSTHIPVTVQANSSTSAIQVAIRPKKDSSDLVTTQRNKGSIRGTQHQPTTNQSTTAAFRYHYRTLATLRVSSVSGSHRQIEIPDLQGIFPRIGRGCQHHNATPSCRFPKVVGQHTRVPGLDLYEIRQDFPTARESNGRCSSWSRKHRASRICIQRRRRAHQQQ